MYRNAPPDAPGGFPLSSQFDPDDDGLILEHFAPTTALAATYAAAGKYFVCGTSASLPPGTVSLSGCSGTGINAVWTANVQGAQLLEGLYYITGKVDLSASNLTAKITIVSGAQLNVSGSIQGAGATVFTPFHQKLLFASEWINPESANSDIAKDALKIAGQQSDYKGILVATNGRTELSGSENTFTCPVMGDRVNMNGSRLFVSGEDCAGPTVVTEIHKETPALHTNLGDGPSTVELGTAIHDKVVVSSQTNSNLTQPIVVRRFDNGLCQGGAAATATFTAGSGMGTTYVSAPTVTLDPVLSFTPATTGLYSYQATYSAGDPNNAGPVVGKCEGPVRVVDARISIAPNATNAVGDPAHVHRDGTAGRRPDGGAGWRRGDRLGRHGRQRRRHAHQ